MLKGPEIYNPLYSVENATNRRNTVLQNMVAAGYIDQKTADQSAAVDIHGQLVDAYEGKSEDYRYPSYFDAVINEAVNEYGLTEEDIVKNGYRIYTELDQNYQASMQVIYDNTALFPVAEDARARNLVVWRLILRPEGFGPRRACRKRSKSRFP